MLTMIMTTNTNASSFVTRTENDVFFGVEEEEEDSTRREEEQRPAAKLSQISRCESREEFKHGERQHFQRQRHRKKSEEF